MTLQVLVAHTGERLAADPTSFASLDTLKAWLAEAVGVAPPDQILLTAHGKQVKYQAILVETDIFLYDRQIVTSQSSSSAQPQAIAAKHLVSAISPSPDSLANQNDIHAWRALFRARRDWAQDLAQQTRAMADEAQAHFEAFQVIERALSVAVGNLQNHVTSLQQRQQEAQTFIKQATQEHVALLRSLDSAMGHIESLPADPAFARFLMHIEGSAQTDSRLAEQGPSSLRSFVEDRDLEDASSSVNMIATYLNDQMASLVERVKEVVRDSEDLVGRVERLFGQSIANLHRNTAQVMNEVEVVAKKITSDYEHVMTLSNDQASVSRASKTALLHTRNHLPSMKEFCEEMAQYLQDVVRQRNESATRAVETMHAIAVIEGAFAQVNHKVKSLDIPQDAGNALEYVTLITQLPYVYGALLVEAVRRREWADRIRSESSYLAEDIASYREEEERRRKKWAKNVGPFIKGDVVAGDVLNFELNLQAEETEWPNVSRDEVLAYIQAVQRSQDLAQTHTELAEAFADIDRPTRRQMKKAKGFKLGSMHEGGASKGSFFLRDNDELRILRDTNSRLEDDLKSHKSRVRKLEDLLYKQSITSRTSSTNFYPANMDPPPPRSPEPVVQEPLIPSPKSGDNSLPRQASINARRLSANKSTEEKSFAHRIVTLEAELTEEKQKRQALEKTATSREESNTQLQAEVEESRSTKRDLMENMEAQQREFSEDRRILQDEAKKYKIRIEELEEEIDRVLGSRDQERAGNEDQIHAVEQDLEQARKELSEFQTELKSREETLDDQTKALRAVHETMAPETRPPEMLSDLVKSLEELSERSVRRAREVESAAAAAKADAIALQTSIDKQEREMSSLRSQLSDLNDELTAVRDERDAGQARAVSLETELEDGRSQLRTIRQRLGEGEKGSEMLRQRVEEQSAKAASLSSELAQTKSHVNSLDIELSSVQRRHKNLQEQHQTLSQRLERRSGRDRELTNRLIARNQDAIRLLDGLGLSVLRSDKGIVIHRTSKLASASVSLDESILGTSPRPEDVNASILAAHAFKPTIESSLMQWTAVEDEEKEAAAYQRFLAKLDEFNLNTFSEAVLKLKRDVEWTGRKWKAEARGYRDKYQRAKSDADSKIAYRSFKEGDLALFLPTRNQATRPWAAFNVGAPHYFLREQDSHRLKNREWLVARIQKVEERVVNMSRTLDSLRASDGRSVGEASEGAASLEDDNPFELSDGLRWYMLDASEEKSGAPSTPGLGKSTVASAHVDAKADMRMKKAPAGKDASATLNKSLESRRSSSNSKRESIIAGLIPDIASGAAAAASGNTSGGHSRRDSQASMRSSPQVPSSLSRETAAGSDHDQPADAPPSGSPATASLMGFLGALTPGRRAHPRPRTPESPAHVASPLKPTSSPQRMRGAGAPARSGAWESLWSLDLNLEEGPGAKRGGGKK